MKVYPVYECQECPHYVKYALIEGTHPDFWCSHLKKVVDPFLIDEECKLEDGE